MSAGRSFGLSAGLSALQTLLARVAMAAFGIATGIVVARWLGPEGKGVYSGVQTLLAVPIAVCSGGGAAITYILTKQRRTVRDLFPALFVTFAALCTLSLAAVAAYALVRGWTIEAAALALALPPSIVLSWQQSYYVAHGRVRRLNVQQVLLAIATLGATAVTVMWLHAGVLGAIAAWLAATYAFAAIIVVDAIRDGGRLHTVAFRETLGELARVGSQSALNAGLGLLNYRIDSLILIAMLGMSSFGVYSIAVSAGEMLFLISRAANTAIGREVGMADAQRSAEITAWTIRAGFATCALAAVPVALFAPALIHAVYGARFDAAALPLRLLLPGIVAFASAGTFASFFIFQLGRPVFVTVTNVVMIAAQSAGCIVLIPRHGLAGAAAASTLTYIIGALVSTVIFSKLTHVPPQRVWLISRADLAQIKRILLRKNAPETMPPENADCMVLTGAAGNVASLIRPLLVQRHALVLTDRRRMRDVRSGERFVRADLNDLNKLRAMMRGAKAVVHLGGISKEASFDAIAQANLRGVYTLLEAARLEHVPRVVIASSGHVTGFYPRSMTIDETAPPRPDSLYAVSKYFAETLARYYCDKFGMNIVCIRIGHVSERPQYAIDRSIWLSPADLTQLIEAALEAPPGFHLTYGASANEALFWKLERAQSLGYVASDGARAEDCPPADAEPAIARIAQGEWLAAQGFRAAYRRSE